MPTPASSFDRLPPAIAEALTERGFTALTPVQERVLDPALEGVDLRISSQTGSGKTVAIGFILAPALIERAELERPTSGPAQPFAILIAPTRELAAQLSRELTWLYAKLRVGVTVVAGGASYRDEKRALSKRPLVVVGTPGRLKDHLERGSIDATMVASVVLDEADQMLDLGFRDELEAILATLPAERRTHLMSATFPREVVALANRYQQDAVRVEGTDLGAANSDITHVAHLVHSNEREAALINLLLMAPGERTLLFVRTRADASELSERLTRAGFHSMPLSGELEQRDRNRTLEAFRIGAVTTLVATDVAARGLDIPEVGRVIHVDPPTDSEGLTHRSGRTGRAGRKGTSIILVPPSARFRVEGLFKRARVQAKWRSLPSPQDVFRAADDRLSAELAAASSETADPRLDALAERLLGELDPETLVRLLLARAQSRGSCQPRQVTAIPLPRDREAPSSDDRHARGKRRDAGDFVRFRINWGEAEGADKGRILATICRRGGVKADQIGAIRIGPDESTFDVSKHSAEKFERRMRRPDPRNPTVRIECLEAPPARGPAKKSAPRHLRKSRTEERARGRRSQRVGGGRFKINQ